MPLVGESTHTGRKVVVALTVILVLVAVVGAFIASTTSSTKTFVRLGVAVVEPSLESQTLYAEAFSLQSIAEPVEYFPNCESFLASVAARLAAGYGYRVAVINTGLPQVVNGQALSNGANIYSEGPLCFDRVKAIDPGLPAIAVLDNNMQNSYWQGRGVTEQIVRNNLFDVVAAVARFIK